MSGRRALPALVGAAVLGGAAAGAPSLRYTAAHLNCAHFEERARSVIETGIGDRVIRATAGREGRWRFRARDTTGGVRLEGWYDSLRVWRRAGDVTLAPETGGLVGGRYRGILSPVGAYQSIARPFVPPEIAEVAEMGATAEDLLPPLPPRALEVGETWRDTGGLEIRRLADSGTAPPLHRFALSLRRETREATAVGDTLTLALHQVSVEEGVFVWNPRLGLVRRERRIAVEATIPPDERLPRPVRSRVEQRVLLTRIPPPPEPATACE